MVVIITFWLKEVAYYCYYSRICSEHNILTFWSNLLHRRRWQLFQPSLFIFFLFLLIFCFYLLIFCRRRWQLFQPLLLMKSGRNLQFQPPSSKKLDLFKSRQTNLWKYFLLRFYLFSVRNPKQVSADLLTSFPTPRYFLKQPLVALIHPTPSLWLKFW